MNTILLYSKYSQTSQTLFNLIQSSGVDFSFLKPICVDNKNVRKRIQNDTRFDIKHVPCVLILYLDGRVEKYENHTVFEWIKTFLPPQPQPSPQHFSQDDYEEDEDEDFQDRNRREIHDNEKKFKELQNRKQQELEQKDAKQRFEDEMRERMRDINISEKPVDSKIKVPSRMKKINENRSSLEDLEKLDESDRHRLTRQPKRLPQGDTGAYIESDELFSGELMEHRKQPKNSVRPNTQKTVHDPQNAVAKAKLLAQERDMIEESVTQKRPEFIERES
jgi:hypothetical protein